MFYCMCLLGDFCLIVFQVILVVLITSQNMNMTCLYVQTLVIPGSEYGSTLQWKMSSQIRYGLPFYNTSHLG